MNNSTPCKYCSSLSRFYTTKIIPTNKAYDPYFPKYIPQIKESCDNCGRYIRFAPQTSELIEELNQKLEEIRCG